VRIAQSCGCIEITVDGRALCLHNSTMPLHERISLCIQKGGNNMNVEQKKLVKDTLVYLKEVRTSLDRINICALDELVEQTQDRYDSLSAIVKDSVRGGCILEEAETASDLVDLINQVDNDMLDMCAKLALILSTKGV
jgi:hypothetical protein